MASYIGKRADDSEINHFLNRQENIPDRLEIPGINKPYKMLNENSSRILLKNTFSLQKKPGRSTEKLKIQKEPEILSQKYRWMKWHSHRHLLNSFLSLSMLGFEGVPLQTIAPKFSGRFNKGVDYAGDP